MNLRAATVPRAEGAPPGFAFAGVPTRERTGNELLGAGLYELDPGNQLWPYHFHIGNEEWAIVISGAPTLRTPDGERELRAGDVVGFPQGEAGAHTFYNRGSEPSRIVIFSTQRSGYPVYVDSDKVAAAGRVFRRGDGVDYWDGEESRA